MMLVAVVVFTVTGDGHSHDDGTSHEDDKRNADYDACDGEVDAASADECGDEDACGDGPDRRRRHDTKQGSMLIFHTVTQHSGNYHCLFPVVAHGLLERKR